MAISFYHATVILSGALAMPEKSWLYRVKMFLLMIRIRSFDFVQVDGVGVCVLLAVFAFLLNHSTAKTTVADVQNDVLSGRYCALGGVESHFHAHSFFVRDPHVAGLIGLAITGFGTAIKLARSRFFTDKIDSRRSQASREQRVVLTAGNDEFVARKVFAYDEPTVSRIVRLTAYAQAPALAERVVH